MSIHSVDISLDNVDSKETFEYSVILLKGKVTCQENCCKALLNGKISVSIESEVFDFDVKEGRFKCIVELELGLNFLKIIYNNDLHLGQYTLTLERKSNLCDKVLKLLCTLINLYFKVLSKKLDLSILNLFLVKSK